MLISRSRRLRQFLTAAAVAALGGLALAGIGGTARADAPYCWGPYYNTAYDCPDYSATYPYLNNPYSVYAPPYAYPYLYPYGY